MKIDTVLFDLDGTLLDTLEDLTDSVNYALSLSGFPIRTPKEIRSYIGNGVYNLVCRAVPEETEVPLIDKTFEAFKDRYFHHYIDKTRPYPGISDLVGFCVKCGFKLAILSNKRHTTVYELGRHFFPDQFNIIYGERPEVKRKPDPQIIHLALHELESAPEESVLIGDTEIDIKTAKNAGIRSIAVTWGFRDRDVLENAAPDWLVDSTAAIEDILRAETNN